MIYPQLIDIRRRFTSPALRDIKATIASGWQIHGLSGRIRAGDRVALAVGSRGITSIVPVVKTIGKILVAAGARPFIVPAMGSHGGATAGGQTRVLEGLGITETAAGIPIHSSMDVHLVGKTDDNLPVYMDRQAWEAEHTILVARIKPHTDFSGSMESGLHKMLVIGLGKLAGAQSGHVAFLSSGFEPTLRSVGAAILKKANILAGVAIVENHRHETAHIEIVLPEKFVQREKALLELARQWMPDLPIKDVDLLIVDQMGKEISGTGMDTNVIGRKYLIHGVGDPGAPRVTRLFVRDLTDRSKGNATGIGLADYTHSRLVNKIDRRITYDNCITAANPRSAAIPVYFDRDRDAINAALKTIGTSQTDQARIVWIRNTLDLESLQISLACRGEITNREDVEIIGPPFDFDFNDSGNLLARKKG